MSSTLGVVDNAHCSIPAIACFGVNEFPDYSSEINPFFVWTDRSSFARIRRN